MQHYLGRVSIFGLEILGESIHFCKRAWMPGLNLKQCLCIVLACNGLQQNQLGIWQKRTLPIDLWSSKQCSKYPFWSNTFYHFHLPLQKPLWCERSPHGRVECRPSIGKSRKQLQDIASIAKTIMLPMWMSLSSLDEKTNSQHSRPFAAHRKQRPVTQAPKIACDQSNGVWSISWIEGDLQRLTNASKWTPLLGALLFLDRRKQDCTTPTRCKIPQTTRAVSMWVKYALPAHIETWWSWYFTLAACNQIAHHHHHLLWQPLELVSLSLFPVTNYGVWRLKWHRTSLTPVIVLHAEPANEVVNHASTEIRLDIVNIRQILFHNNFLIFKSSACTLTAIGLGINPHRASKRRSFGLMIYWYSIIFIYCISICSNASKSAFNSRPWKVRPYTRSFSVERCLMWSDFRNHWLCMAM